MEQPKSTSRWTTLDGFVASAVLNSVLIILLGIISLPRQGGPGEPLQFEGEMGTAAAAPESLGDTSSGAVELPLDAVVPLDAPTDPAAVALPAMDEAMSLGSAASDGARDGQGTGSGGDGQGASFFGASSGGDRFVYVLDMSASMDERTSSGGSTRFRRASAELLRSIGELTEAQAFVVILFSSDTRLMFDDLGPLPQLLPATQENKDQLRGWLEQVQPEGGTDPREALRLGLTIRPSALFLLSDGDFQPEENRRNKETNHLTIPEVVERNNHAHAPIHTIAYEGGDRRVMELLAAQSGGQHRFVAPVIGKIIARVAPTAEELSLQAEVRLAQIKRLEARGLRRQALDRYRRLRVEYPNTPAAAEAERRADQLSQDIGKKRVGSTRN